MRWLVPTASAISRSDRSPIPPLANSVMSPSSSSARRWSSGGRGIRATLLDARLQAFALHLEVALGEPTNHQPDRDTDGAALFDSLADDRAIPAGRQRVGGGGGPAERLPPPGPRHTRLDCGHLPDELRHPRLPYLETAADRDLRPVQPDHALDRCSPVRPAFDIRVNVPDG